ncbi:MAG: type IV secretory system conjugative DNA transfer family protein [Bacteroidetes bacterium]|nr:type IV secretory system conjugative DNA transfer family protein [Bacteroidota bacterium]
MTKPNTMQMKDTLLLVLVFALLAVGIDYLGLIGVGGAATKRFSFQLGEIVKALYFLLFIVISFYNSKQVFAKTSRRVQFSSAVKISLYLISFFSIAILLFISNLSTTIIYYLYPTLFFVANACLLILILHYRSSAPIQTEATSLTLESKASEKDLALVLEGHGGYVNIPNPFRSVLVIGGAGAGKSASVAEPIIYKAIEKKYAGFVYDFKFPTLANCVYSSFLYHKRNEIKFFPISFTELSKSHRFNPLDPRFLESQTHVEEYAWALYSNLDREAIKKGGFFPESAAGLLKAVIWFMKRNFPDYCTLPHVINILLNAETSVLVKMISSDVETKGMMKSVKEASEKNAYDQLAGVIGSLTMQLQKINTPEINWVLTGNDFTIDLNNITNPKFVVLGSDPSVRNALSPIIAFIGSVFLKVMNQQGKHQSIALIDEGPTIYIPNLDEVPATARSNKLAVVYMAQDFSQMDAMYGKDKRNALVSNLATQFFGNVSGLETAKYVSELVGREYRYVESVNLGESTNDSGSSQNQGKSYSEQHREILKPQDMFSLEQGVFVGKVVESEKSWFKGKLKRVQDFNSSFSLSEIPEFVSDFKISEEKINEFNQQVASLESSPVPLVGQSFEIEEVQQLFKSGGISIDVYKERLLGILIKQEQRNIRATILEENFMKVQKEVESILILFK